MHDHGVISDCGLSGYSVVPTKAQPGVFLAVKLGPGLLRKFFFPFSQHCSVLGGLWRFLPGRVYHVRTIRTTRGSNLPLVLVLSFWSHGS